MRKVFGRLLWIPAALFMSFAVIAVFVLVMKNGTGNGGATFWTAAAKKQADEIAINCSDEEQKVKAFTNGLLQILSMITALMKSTSISTRTKLWKQKKAFVMIMQIYLQPFAAHKI